MRFHTRVLLEGKTATGLQVPDEVVAGLGAGKRPAVRITINSYSYRTTAMFMGGRFLVPLAAEHRDAAGVSAGDEVEVDIELDTTVREVVVPADLAAALAAQPSVQTFFDQLSFTYRKEMGALDRGRQEARDETGPTHEDYRRTPRGSTDPLI